MNKVTDAQATKSVAEAYVSMVEATGDRQVANSRDDGNVYTNHHTGFDHNSEMLNHAELHRQNFEAAAKRVSDLASKTGHPDLHKLARDMHRHISQVHQGGYHQGEEWASIDKAREHLNAAADHAEQKA